MDGWKAYSRLYDRLTPEAQEEEWATLTDEERRQFEAGRLADEDEARQVFSVASPEPPSARTIAIALGTIVAIVVLLAGIIAALNAYEEHRDAVRAEQEKQAEEEEQQATVRRYRESASEILARVNEAMNSGKHQEAIALMAPFLVAEDPELLALHDEATQKLAAAQREEEISELLAKVDKTSEKNFVMRRDLYRQLVELAPSEASFSERVEFYSREIEEQVEERRREQENRRLAGKWRYSAVTDQMSGRPNVTASIESENTVNFGFPYDGEQRATLTLRTHPTYGRDVIFRIEQGQILCSSFDRCQLRIRFDDGAPQTWRARPPSDRSTTVVFLDSYALFLQRLRGAETVRIQPEIYQEGNPVFEFQVGGYDHQRFTGQ